MGKKLNENVIHVEPMDYKEPIKSLYQKHNSKIQTLLRDYNYANQVMQIYALSKTDSNGTSIKGNKEAYDNTIEEKKRIGVMIRLLQSEMELLENIWTKKGFDIVELRNSSKKLQELKKKSDE